MGDDVDPRMASLWTATTLGFAGVFSFLAFFGVFLVRELDTSPSAAGVVLGIGAGAGVAGAFLGGALSDRLGRKPVIVAAAATQTLAATAFALYGRERAVAYAALLALNFLQPLRGATQRAFAADLAADGDTERQLAFLRVGVNLGASAGPGLGALLVSVSWGVQQSFTAIAFALSLAAALRLPVSPPMPGRASSRRAGVLRDRTFLALFAGGALAWTVFAALETLLPVLLSASGRVSPAGWGALLALNPVLIVVGQMRVSRATAGWARRRKLVLALALLSVPYLALTASAAAWVLVGVVLTVTAGECSSARRRRRWPPRPHRRDRSAPTSGRPRRATGSARPRRRRSGCPWPTLWARRRCGADWSRSPRAPPPATGAPRRDRATYCRPLACR
jgi:predicted MFS family arabinose efflux permease